MKSKSKISRAITRIVFPEGSEPRIIQAACILRDQGLAKPILLGAPAAVKAVADEFEIGLEHIVVVDPLFAEQREHYIKAYASGPRQTSLKIANRLLRKPLFFGAMMVRCGDVFGMIAGVANPTSRIIEAGAMGVGLVPGIQTPSSFFIMTVPDFQGLGEKKFIFADCAVNIEPTADQLADIAIASAASASSLLNQVPRIAFLSFSTQGSARHSTVDKIAQAVLIAQSRAPDLLIDGEFQADAAIIPAVAEKKLKQASEVAGQANVLIFPDLNSGNIAYKLTQYLAGAQATGPVLQGFAKPVCDLSRGASVEDIVAATELILQLG